jgi:hypothetical protein
MQRAAEWPLRRDMSRGTVGGQRAQAVRAPGPVGRRRYPGPEGGGRHGVACGDHAPWQMACGLWPPVGERYVQNI